MTVKGDLQNPQALGRAIQQARALRGMSQRDLAAQLGISQRWLWELEQGKPGIFTDRLFEVLRAVQARLTIEIDEPEAGSPAGPGE
ncbi:MAG: helix-turn-helix domain-containing protein [Demequinaceae bacterium]|nr:helix-turn-helix domain-containing protein [Demequinaceae bacterium]